MTDAISLGKTFLIDGQLKESLGEFGLGEFREKVRDAAGDRFSAREPRRGEKERERET